jgi:hypothetical protein
MRSPESWIDAQSEDEVEVVVDCARSHAPEPEGAVCGRQVYESMKFVVLVGRYLKCL